MDYGPTDSSGTDDDFPPFIGNRGTIGRPMAGSRKNTVGALPHTRVQNDMESLIHQLEQDAYCSVLRAFKAQADAITWEKEGLITELRKELRLTNEEHRELLRRVNADDTIKLIREWRQAGGVQSNIINNAQTSHDLIPSPTVSASRKRHKTANALASLTMGGSLPLLHSQSAAASLHPSAATVKQGNMSGAIGKKIKQPLQKPSPASFGRDQARNISEPGEVAANASLVGRKVMTRWPDDNNFYEATITDYKPQKGLHALVYDMDTENETWEWVNLSEIAPEDIRWVDDEPGMGKHGGHSGLGPGCKKLSGFNGVIPGKDRGRGPSKNQCSKGYMLSQTWNGKKGYKDIKMLDTQIVLKDVERVLDTSLPDPLDVEKAKQMLKEQEQALVDAIARIDNMSDSSSEGDDQFLHRQTKESIMAWTERQHGRKQQAYHFQGIHEGGEGSDGDQIAGDGTASSYQRDDYYGL